MERKRQRTTCIMRNGILQPRPAKSSRSTYIHSSARAHLCSFAIEFLIQMQTLKNFMKAVAVLLLVALALLLGGCGSDQTQAQQDAGGVWQANLSGTDSGLSFIAQFTVNANGSLTITNFQFLNNESCFPYASGSNGATPAGALTNLTYNSADQIISGNLSFTIGENGNILTLTSTSVNGTLSGSSLTGGVIQGNWTLQAGSSSGCSNSSGIFTMTQSTTT
jgi:hypothetical protein